MIPCREAQYKQLPVNVLLDTKGYKEACREIIGDVVSTNYRYYRQAPNNRYFPALLDEADSGGYDVITFADFKENYCTDYVAYGCKTLEEALFLCEGKRTQEGVPYTRGMVLEEWSKLEQDTCVEFLNIDRCRFIGSDMPYKSVYAFLETSELKEYKKYLEQIKTAKKPVKSVVHTIYGLTYNNTPVALRVAVEQDSLQTDEYDRKLLEEVASDEELSKQYKAFYVHKSLNYVLESERADEWVL